VYSVVGIVPMRFPGLDGITAVTAGMDEDGAFALDSRGVVWALGDDSVGGHPFRPRRVVGLPPVAAISQGTETALALDRQAQVWDIGGATPLLVAGLPPVRVISAGEWSAALALGVDGSAWSFITGSSVAPVQIPLPRAAVAVSAGDEYYGALLDDGSVWTWITPGSAGAAAAPARVHGLDGIVGLWVGRGGPSLAVDGYGATWTWSTTDAEYDAIPPGEECPTLAPRPFRPGHHPELMFELQRLRAPRRRR